MHTPRRFREMPANVNKGTVMSAGRQTAGHDTEMPVHNLLKRQIDPLAEVLGALRNFMLPKVLHRAAPDY